MPVPVDAVPAPRAGVAPAVWFCLLAGVVATWPGYHFGDDNQLETLPAIGRLLDPTSGGRDLIATALTQYGPRWWFVRAAALLGGFLPLPWLFALATVGCNAAVIQLARWPL